MLTLIKKMNIIKLLLISNNNFMNIIRRFWKKPTCQCLMSIASIPFILPILIFAAFLFLSWIFGIIILFAYLLAITGPIVGIQFAPDDNLLINVNNALSSKYLNMIINYDNHTYEEIFIAITILFSLTVIPAIFIGIYKCFYYELGESNKKSLLLTLFTFFIIIPSFFLLLWICVEILVFFGFGFNTFLSYSISMHFNMTAVESKLNNMPILISPLLKISILIGFILVPSILILILCCCVGYCYKDIKETYEDIETGNTKKEY